ncbi:PTS sugar transporter subunit IIB [Lacticaseibacillus sp. N501-2]|uniref:PTS sugar transporter subunit IIB n=1 Tax=Lacticaseibacillus salsurae TaxID=3367729 RepID=UPI0038B30059
MAKILLMCAGGMSTSILAKHMQQASTALGRQDVIVARPAADIRNRLLKEAPDVLLIGPQIRFMLSQIESAAEGFDLPMTVMPNHDYGTMNGEAMMALAISLMPNKNA